ncbi:2Fe-2S iron-sulfur cluster-binding protein [Aliagarivorans taiwanensis]|uniref:2Fe-2S iron-sulfur cluster-binding protein n=1 Tax=Aliagarivorans taiwanensis TaxID=561966 RepID=UPI000685F0FE|nr:2Fe-2S iron-sulfur cluster-binding protein [Aliagarivorans taiwanensis]
MENEHRIRLTKSGTVPSVCEFLARESETILQAALRQGVKWPHRCRAGACLSCAARAFEGEWAYQVEPMLSQHEQSQGWLLACIAQARSDLHILL